MRRFRRPTFFLNVSPATGLVIVFSFCCLASVQLEAQTAQPPTPKSAAPSTARGADTPASPADTETSEDSFVPLTPNKAVLFDRQRKRILVKTQVVMQNGVLEMLLCRKQTKEHESILAVDAPAQAIHAGLVLLGAKPGRPVQFTPKYAPPTGSRLAIHVLWKDANGKSQRAPAEHWIRHAIRRYHVARVEQLPSDLKLPADSELKYDAKTRELYWYGPMSAKERDTLLKYSADKGYQKLIRHFYDEGQVRPMQAEWVFAGSYFVEDPETGKRYYQAEAGDFICVANFATAMIDVAERSSASGTESLLYEAWEERIPPLGTEVTLELTVAPLTSSEKPSADESTVPKQPAEQEKPSAATPSPAGTPSAP